MSASPDTRLRALEDRAEIAELIAQYGPAVDRGDAEAVRGLWAENGEYVFDDTVLDYAGIATLVDLDTHREYMRRGSAHVISAPTITLDGDIALAVTHSVVLIASGDVWEPARVSANRWELVRTADGWRVQRRLNRLLDGAVAAQALLAPDPATSRND